MITEYIKQNFGKYLVSTFIIWFITYPFSGSPRFDESFRAIETGIPVKLTLFAIFDQILFVIWFFGLLIFMLGYLTGYFDVSEVKNNG